jgi:hypothetical protein
VTRATAGDCSHGPIKLPPVPEAVAALSPEEQLTLVIQLIAEHGTEEERHYRRGIAAAIRERLDFVPDAVDSDDVRVRLTLARDPRATSATLDWLEADPSWRVRSRVRAEVYERRTWRFIRGLP